MASELLRLSLGSSPRKRTFQGSSGFASSVSSASMVRKSVDKELMNFWIGPMPEQDFLNDFLPLPSGVGPPPDAGSHFNIPKCRSEKELCEKFVDKMNDPALNLIPDYKMVLSCDESDPNQERKFRCDTDLYRGTVDTSRRNRNQTRFSQVKCELKNKKLDPFNDVAPRKGPWTFEKATESGESTRGQLATYASEVLSRQHRLHIFQVYIAYPIVRLIRADRAGIIVSKRFDMTTPEGSQTLADFFYRFSHCNSDEVRGLDPTAEMLDDDDDDAQLAREKLGEYKQNDLIRPVFRFNIPEGETTRKFLAWHAMSDVASVVGRATRVYPVYEADTDSIYMLKDSWRASSLEPEAEILRKLNCSWREPGQEDVTKIIRHIPTFLCGGDVQEQSTLTHLYASDGPDHPDPARHGIQSKAWKVGQHADDIIKRIHHRFVEKEVGKPLEQFTSTKQLVRVITDALIAHRDAYTTCRILHRDISARNILILPDGRGMLNDWDMAKDIDSQDIRYHHRTGTWQFISAASLMDPEKVHDLQDDLESFILVAFYHIILYTAHTLAARSISIIKAIFDERTYFDDGEVLGGVYKQSMFLNQYLIRKLHVHNNEAMNNWFRQLLAAGREWYLERGKAEDIEASGPSYSAETDNNAMETPSSGKQSNPPTIALPMPTLKLTDHEYLIGISEKLLLPEVKWPENDRVADPVGLKPETLTIHPNATTSQTSVSTVSSLRSVNSTNSLKRYLDDDSDEFESDREVKRAKTPAEPM